MPAYYVRCAFRSHNKAGGNLVVNVTHWEVDTLTSPIDMTGVATDLANHFLTTYTAVLSTFDHWDDVTCTIENYPGAPIGQGIHLVGVDGARASSDNFVSVGLCCLISRRSGTPRRWGRGRTFCPPAYTINSTTTGGTWAPSGAYFVACGVFASSLQTGFTQGSTSYVPIIYSRSRALTNQTPFISPVTQCIAQPQQHFLRSRLSSP